MKFIITAIFILTTTICYSQIPNANFENWTNSMPDEWQINSSPPGLLPVTQTTDAADGMYALKGEVVLDSGIAFGPYIEPITTNFGFPLTQNETMLYGWYKADLLLTNMGLIEVSVFDTSGNLIGFGIDYMHSAATFTAFAIPIIYTPGTMASEMSIVFQMTDTTVTGIFQVGSYFIVDYLSFAPTILGMSNINQLPFSVYPNPVSDKVNISGEFKSGSTYDAKIYNTTGELVYSNAIIASGEKLQPIDVSNLQNGNYLLVIKNDKKTSTKKLLINHF